MLNEMLLLEVRAHEAAAAQGSTDKPTPDLVSRVRGYLEMRIHGERHTHTWAVPATGLQLSSAHTSDIRITRFEKVTFQM